MSQLSLSTVEEKITAICNLAFPEMLQQLEAALGFFGYYRKFIPYYSAIIEPLQDWKTFQLKEAPKKGQKCKKWVQRLVTGSPEALAECRKAWDLLKELLTSSLMLAFPDFDKAFIFYIDGSKERRYGIAVHQIGTDLVECLVLYLSKSLSSCEKNY